ncbi:MAG: hypothetical protein M1833_003645 [Piccolia ochrophora]|nr:MAG: hypothetical protein M1833_003645 [Piccolia ochrophora]
MSAPSRRGDLNNSKLPQASQRRASLSHRSTPLDRPGSDVATSSRESSSPPHENETVHGRPAHQRFVFTDPVAFRYLEEDPSTIVLERRRRLEGYQLYIVEQWACSRVHPTFVVTTYTGDPAHTVVIGVLSVPTSEESWSPRLRIYFKAMTQFHARRKETPLGVLMVTNLSGFPSALSVIAVADGDIKKHREDFIVNENLKRMGCSGRAGLNLEAPAAATQAKFHQLYRTSDRVPLYGAVIELAKLCQVALILFDKLANEYADGLLCDVTERAINDWWTEVGTDFYNIEPSDGILGPVTVAALLGLLMGARNRLNTYGAPVPKDVFEVGNFKRGVAYFQKSQKLARTRRLERRTLDRLHRTTAKAASSDGWNVPRAVKSTVAELSGKGGEMVMGMVGARDKAGIAEIETLDMERFVQLLSGDRAKWLWHGKPRKSTAREPLGRTPGEELMGFGQDDPIDPPWSALQPDSGAPDGHAISRASTQNVGVYGKQAPGSTASIESPIDKDPYLRRTLFKSVTGRKADSRSGFERIKDAVGISGLRGHHYKHSRDESLGADARENVVPSPESPTGNATHSPTTSLAESGSNNAIESHQDERASTQLHVGRMSKERLTDHADGERSSADPQAESPFGSRMSLSPPPEMAIENIERDVDIPNNDDVIRHRNKNALERTAKQGASASSITKVPSFPTERGGHKQDGKRSFEDVDFLLLRSKSLPSNASKAVTGRNSEWWPRQLSFSRTEDAVHTWADIGPNETPRPIQRTTPRQALDQEHVRSAELKRTYELILQMEDLVGMWARQRVEEVEMLDEQASRDQEELNGIYLHHLNRYQASQAGTTGFLADERSHLSDAVREVEVLSAKLEYEVNALATKVEDTEDGVAEFDKAVADIELRTRELEMEEAMTESWYSWTFRTLIGRPGHETLRASANAS